MNIHRHMDTHSHTRTRTHSQWMIMKGQSPRPAWKTGKMSKDGYRRGIKQNNPPEDICKTESYKIATVWPDLIWQGKKKASNLTYFKISLEVMWQKRISFSNLTKGKNSTIKQQYCEVMWRPFPDLPSFIKNPYLSLIQRMLWWCPCRVRLQRQVRRSQKTPNPGKKKTIQVWGTYHHVLWSARNELILEGRKIKTYFK